MDPNLIYDVGLHKGEDSEFYLKKGFRVVAIDAMASLCDFARHRLKSYLDSCQLSVLNAAIAQNDGPVTFYENVRSVWGTTSPEWVRRNQIVHQAPSKPTIVKGVRFAGVMRQFGVPYYLKIDIEGADLLCVEALREFTSRPRYVSLESNMASWMALQAEFNLLRELGYTRFKVIRQDDVRHQVCPLPATEGRYVDHQFAYGSTGLFGEEAPGQWLSETEALERYRRIFRRYRMFGNYSVLRRLPMGRRLIHILRLTPGWHDTHAAR